MILQAGYYNKTKDRMSSISLQDGKLEITDEKEVFKRPETDVKELVLEDIKIEFEKMQELLKSFISENYPKEKLTKEIIILQNTDVKESTHTVWNVTYITDTFKVLNIKLDALEGEVLSHELRSIMEFRTNS